MMQRDMIIIFSFKGDKFVTNDIIETPRFKVHGLKSKD